ncbi:TonB-dependent receptor [Erythrobacter sp. NE805]|uniref:TonB-dependent receptor n=1 Tax=Erythrobacter sp. NE805 TaxID=3389875 RepID=UPI00396B2468
MVGIRNFAIRTALAAGVASAALAAGAASAQDSGTAAAEDDADRSVSANEIIVTATKRNERLVDVPMGVTVITGEELEKRQVRSFQDLTAFVPGLSIQTSSPVVTRLILRGLNAGGAGSTVAVYVDDSPIGSSNALLQGALLTSNLDTFDMAAIEVLKGPQGTLYGANSQGGLIKYVTNAPDTSGFSGRAQGEINSVDGGEIGYAVRGVVNAPLGEKAAIRASGFYQKLPGFIDDTNLGIEDVNSGKRYGGRLSLKVDATETLTARVTGFYQRLETRADPNVDVVGSPRTYALPGPDIFKPFAGDLEQRRYLLATRSQDFYNIGGELDWDLGGVTLESITSYSRAENRQLRDGGAGAAGYLPPASPAAPFGVPVSANFFLTNFLFGGQPTLLRGKEYFKLTKFTQELRLQSQGEGFLGWQIGGFYTHENTFSSQDQQFVNATTGAVITTPPGPGGEYTIDARYTEFAGFGEIDLRFSPRFEINAGIRYSTNDQRALLGVGNGFLGIPAGQPPSRQTINTDEDAVTFSVSPKWKVNEDTLIYGRVASGFRPGGPNLVPPNAPPNYPLGYKSDSTMNYELGFRTTLPDRSLSLDIAAYRIDWTDIQIISLVPLNNTIIGVTGNAGEARSEGVEFAVTARPSERLTFMVNGAYTEAKLQQDAPGIGGAKGDRLAWVPDLTLTLDGEYRLPLGGDTEGFFGFTASYVGERFTDFGTSIFATPHIPLPDYTTLSLRAGADIGKIRIEAYARNITDSRGMFTYSNAGAGAPTITGTKAIIQPRTFGLVVTSNF